MRPGGALVLMGGTAGRKISRDLGIIAAATAALPPWPPPGPASWPRSPISEPSPRAPHRGSTGSLCSSAAHVPVVVFLIALLAAVALVSLAPRRACGRSSLAEVPPPAARAAGGDSSRGEQSEDGKGHERSGGRDWAERFWPDRCTIRRPR